MKNKAVTIVCIVLMVLAIICFGYIFVNSKIKEKSNNNKVDKPEDSETIDVDNQYDEREERGQNVNVNSRIGVQLKELIKYAEIYSNSIIDELDTKGINSKVKLLAALGKINSKEEYQSYMEYSEEYNNNYILPENMNKVISSIFKDTSVTEKNVEDILTYDEATNVYVVASRGFAGGNMGNTIEVPYKITEYSDRIELLAYRIYVTKNVEMKETESTMTIDLFYDKAKSIKAMTVEEGVEFTEYNQLDYVEEKINSGNILTNNLETVKYTFKQEGNGYRISSFENI